MLSLLRLRSAAPALFACACGLFATPALANSLAEDTIAKPVIQNPAAPAGPWKKTVVQLSKAEKPPKIDGVLDDECWKHATHVEGFFRFQSNEPIHEQTEAWMCVDKTHLYVAFHCLDAHPDLIREVETQREGNVNHDDFVCIALDTQGNKRNVSQFNISARGTQQTQIEGGTADNLTWAGDWTAATKRTADGWTAEICIPFSVLRYARGTRTFGVALLRQLARETNPEIWPCIPSEGYNNPIPFLGEITGLEPPYYAPRLVALPYILGTAGPNESLRGGLDIKYPISTTLTGLATFHPDFQTIEDAVQNLSFSYTEKYVPDRRPFFVEGSNFLQDSFLFYSQRIPFVDEGAKVIGKQGPTTIAALATTSTQGTPQTSFLTSMTQDLGYYSQIGAAFLGNNSDGSPDNRVARVSGQYGFAKGVRSYTVSANATESWTAGTAPDHNAYVQLQTNAGPGQLNATAAYTETGKNFVNQLGLVPEVDLRGESLYINRFDNFDKGVLESDSFGFGASTYDHMTGGFFHDDVSVNSFWQMRSGLAYEIDADAGKYYPFVDNTVTTAVYWNQKSLLQRGGISFQFGHREDQPYKFISLNQGLSLSKRFSINGSFNLETLQHEQNTQTILSGTYRLNDQETFGGRLVQQNGSVDIYLSYGRRVRKGTDIFVLVGDPNSQHTKGVIIVKLVHPF